MNIYFENGKKYIRIDNFAIEYSEAKKIFNQMYPHYIKTFRAFDSEISRGFDKFISEYSGLVEALTSDEISGVFILYKLASSEIFCGFESLTKGRRILKREHTDSEWQIVLKQYEYKCAYCGCSNKPLQKDHVIPVSKGGDDKITNIVPACQKCNASKGARIL